ncbi:hypothetical protein AX15_001728 [Amanita polypyramis BW_CC]|nr:hypothetical protein AX15_001728 [Amanita polypyramis BW_CC]
MSGDDNSAGRTLDGRVAEALPSSWARPSSGQRTGRIGDWGSNSSSSGRSTGRFATIDRMNTGSPGGPPRPPVDEDDENDDAGRRESWFAGGERSGISIENPDRQRTVPGGDLVRELLRRAAEAGPPPTSPSSRPNIFTGGGHRLGNDEEPSTYIPDPDASAPEQEETAVRHITFWRDGFTVEDGEFMRYDDPANAQILSEINAGRAPPSILNVHPGQPVELRVAKRTNEDYVPPRTQARAFGGTGHRLGAPVPTFTGASSSSQTSAMPGSFPSSSPSGARSSEDRESMSTRFEVDQTKPMTSIQLRLADGTRMVCRMNLTHTVQDIRNFINASRPENLTRPYIIGTTFPNRNLEDNAQTIKSAGLANSVIVQRWA